MKSQLKNELESVCRIINDVISGDSFPLTVRPDALREAVRLYPMRGGKRIRPVLTLWSCGAVGGEPEKALNAAAAVEIFHNWTLVHDDIIDCDEVRRGKPTCHVDLRRQGIERFGLEPERAVKYGTDFAILAGDVQQAWAFDMLLRSTERGVSAETVLAMSRRMQSYLNRDLISGEALDVEFEYRKEIPEKSEVVDMICGKTGVLLSFSAECGAMIGLDTPDYNSKYVSALSGFAYEMGYAFQLCDDLLGVYGDEKTFGKPICSDFREGKPTILFLEAMERISEAGKKELCSMMNRHEYSDSDCDRIRTMLEECGARDAVVRDAEKSSEKAMANLAVLPENKYRFLLEALAEELLKRKV